MTLISQRGSKEPGKWRSITPDEMRKWRAKVARKLATRPRGSVTYEADVAHTRGLGQARAVGDEAILDKPSRETGQRTPRETIEVLTKQMLDWLRRMDGDELRRTFKLLQQTGRLTDRTFEDFKDDLRGLAEKMAGEDAERVYKQYGYDRKPIVGIRSGDAG